MEHSRGFGTLGVNANDRVATPAVALGGSDSFSVFCRVLLTGSQTSFYRIFHWGETFFQLIGTGGATVRAERWRSVTPHDAVEFTIPQDGVAHAVLVVWTGSTPGFTVYVNGAEATTTFISSGSGSFTSGTSPIVWGNHHSLERAMNGRLDECAVWRRMLSLADAEDLYNGADPATLDNPSGPIALYRMNQDSDDEVLGPCAIEGTTLHDPLTTTAPPPVHVEPSTDFGYPIPAAARPTNHNWRDLVLWAGATSVPDAPATRSWPSQFVNFEDYSPGTSNDGPKLEQAISDARAQGRGIAFGTNQTYTINQKVNISGWNSMVWRGNGSTLRAGSSVSRTGGNPWFFFRDATGLRVYDLTFDGNFSARGGYIENFSARSVAISACHDVAFVQSHSIRGCDDGWYIYSDGTVSLNRIGRFHAYLHCGADLCGRNGMSVIIVHDSYIVGGNYRRQQGFSPASGIDYEPNNNAWNDLGVPQITRSFILGVTFEDNFNCGLQFAHMARDDNRNILVQDCLMQRNGAGNVLNTTAFGWGVMVPGRMVSGVFRHNMIRDHDNQVDGMRAPAFFWPSRGASTRSGLYASNEHPGPLLIEGNFFRNNSTTAPGTQNANVEAHSLVFFTGQITIRNNEIDLRGVPNNIHAIDMPNDKNVSITGNVAYRDANSSTAPFRQQAGSNTVITGAPDW